MPDQVLRTLGAAIAFLLVLALVELSFPHGRRQHAGVDQEEADPQVWEVLEEARNITRAAAGE